jgi:ethanolamine utilization protein EutN
MRVGVVIGTVTVSLGHSSMTGARYRIVGTLSLAGLVGDDGPWLDDLVVVDELGAGLGSRIAVSDGAEAAQPFLPLLKPVDAYNSAILDHVEVDAQLMKGPR